MQNRTLRAAVSTRGGSALRELCMTWRTFMEIDRAMQSAGCCIVTPPNEITCTNTRAARTHTLRYTKPWSELSLDGDRRVRPAQSNHSAAFTQAPFRSADSRAAG